MKVINHQYIAPALDDTIKRAAAIAVLTRDETGTLAVYVGVVVDPWVASLTSEDIKRAQDHAFNLIAHCGQKISWRQARCYFDIAEKDYRR